MPRITEVKRCSVCGVAANHKDPCEHFAQWLRFTARFCRRRAT